MVREGDDVYEFIYTVFFFLHSVTRLLVMRARLGFPEFTGFGDCYLRSLAALGSQVTIQILGIMPDMRGQTQVVGSR